MEKTHSNLLRNGGGFFEASKVLGWQQAHKQGDSGSPDGEPSEMPGVGPAGGEGTSCSSSPSPQVGCLHLLGFGSESAWPLSLNPAAEPSTLLPAAGCLPWAPGADYHRGEWSLPAGEKEQVEHEWVWEGREQ